MGTAGTLAICLGVIIVGGGAVYLVSRSVRPPVTAVVQAPSAAVAGINAIAALGAKGFDAYIASKAAKSESDED
jgi:hypothetical protein